MQNFQVGRWEESESEGEVNKERCRCRNPLLYRFPAYRHYSRPQTKWLNFPSAQRQCPTLGDLPSTSSSSSAHLRSRGILPVGFFNIPLPFGGAALTRADTTDYRQTAGMLRLFCATWTQAKKAPFFGTEKKKTAGDLHCTTLSPVEMSGCGS